MLRALAALVSPPAVAVACSLAGVGLAVASVFLLCGLAWALLAGAVPLLLLAAVLIRGLLNAA